MDNFNNSFFSNSLKVFLLSISIVVSALVYAVPDFNIDKKKVNRQVGFLENLDRWLMAYDGARYVDDEYESTYSYSIPYYERDRGGKYSEPYYKERRATLKSFETVCKKMRGKVITAVAYQNTDALFKHDYKFFSDRYEATKQKRRFYDACEVKGAYVSINWEFSKKNNQFSVKIKDIDRYRLLREKHKLAAQKKRYQSKEQALKKAREQKEAVSRDKERLAMLRIEQANSFRQKLAIGDYSTLGMIIDIKRPIAKIQLSNGEERWYKIDRLLPLKVLQ